MGAPSDHIENHDGQPGRRFNQTPVYMQTDSVTKARVCSDVPTGIGGIYTPALHPPPSAGTFVDNNIQDNTPPPAIDSFITHLNKASTIYSIVYKMQNTPIQSK